MGQTIERVSSIWIPIGAAAFIVGSPLARLDAETHFFTVMIGGFTLFCLAVVLPLFSSLVGGRPRSGWEWGLALASYILTVIGVAVGIAVGPRAGIYLVAISLVLALVFTMAQMLRSKVPRSRLYSLPAPFIGGLAAFAIGDNFYSMLAYGLWFSVLLVMIVGAVFLQSLYGERRYMLHYASVFMALVGIFLFIIDYRLQGVRIALLSMLLHVLAMSPWRGIGGRRLRTYLGHVGQGIAATAGLLYSILGYDTVSVAHVAMIGFSVVGVYTQAPLLAPLLVSATWRRKRWRGVSPVIALASALVRPVYPDVSLALLYASFIVLLVELNPSPRRIYYIVRYGTEGGYLRSYLDAVRSVA